VRSGVAGLVLAIGIAAAASSPASPVQFGWTGTIAAVDPGLAAVLPAHSGIQVGARVWGWYVFESTTQDALASTTEGHYAEALLDWKMQLGIYAISHLSGGPTNAIDVVRDPFFAFYEAVDSVSAAPLLPGLTALKADLFLSSFIPGVLASDALPLTPPNLMFWDTKSAGIFQPGSGAPLIDIRLTALCTGPCPDSDQDGVLDDSDDCPFFADPLQADADGDGRGDACECGDQSGDGRVDVSDIVAINRAIFTPVLETPLCDGNNDGQCNVADIVAANVEIFSPGNTSTCARQPVPGP